MYDYYKSFPGYLSMVANILLVGGIIILFIKWQIAIIFFFLTLSLWIMSSYLHKKKMRLIVSEMSTGFKKTSAVLKEKLKDPKETAKLKAKGLSDDEIETMQKLAEEGAEKGLYPEN